MKVIPGKEVFTQHKLVVCDLNIRIEREKKKLYIPKLKVWKLREAEVKKGVVAPRDQHSGNPHVIKEKRRHWKEWKNGSCSKERYIEAKQVHIYYCILSFFFFSVYYYLIKFSIIKLTILVCLLHPLS